MLKMEFNLSSFYFQVASLFGAEKKEISIIEFNHSNNKFVTTMFYESGFLVLVNRLGIKKSPSMNIIVWIEF